MTNAQVNNEFVWTVHRNETVLISDGDFIDYSIKESDLLELGFKVVEHENPLLAGYVFRRTPKFRVWCDAWGRFFIGRTRWAGDDTYWQRVYVDGKAELVRFLDYWVMD